MYLRSSIEIPYPTHMAEYVLREVDLCSHGLKPTNMLLKDKIKERTMQKGMKSAGMSRHGVGY